MSIEIEETNYDYIALDTGYLSRISKKVNPTFLQKYYDNYYPHIVAFIFDKFDNRQNIIYLPECYNEIQKIVDTNINMLGGCIIFVMKDKNKNNKINKKLLFNDINIIINKIGSKSINSYCEFL